MSISVNTSTNGLPAELKRRDQTRIRNYKRYLDFYAGNQFPDAPRASKLRRVTVNYARAFARKASSYVMKGFTVAVEPSGDSDDHRTQARAAEDAWQEIAANNGLARIDMATEVDCAVLGDAAYRVTWDLELSRVAITPVDVAALHVWPHPFDPLRFQRLAYRYELTRDQLAAAFGLASAGETAVITEDWTDATLSVWIDDAPAPALTDPNPYEFVPFVVYPNEQVPKQFWGESDIEPIMLIAQEFNAEYSRLSNIMELSGNPIAVLSGVDAADGIETFPGAIWSLPDGAKADILDALKSGSAAAHLAYLEDLRRCLHDLSETPRTAFGGDTSRQLSGVALEVELEPLLQKAIRKRAIRSDAYAARTGMAFAISDQYAGTALLDAGHIVVNWDALTPRDRTREIADEIALTQSRLSSRRAALLRMGIADPDEELAAIDAETPEEPAPVDNNG